MTEWAELDDVVDVTGRETTPESLALARTMVSMFSGATTTQSDDGLISSRNLRYLRDAVCFQAVWLDSHPDVLDAMDTTGVSQDGLNAQYNNVNAHLLAPMASRCIRRLSWIKGELRVRRSRAVAGERGNRDSAVADDQYVWTPM